MGEIGKIHKAAVEGGLMLLARQLVTILLKMAGLLIITRVLGPSKYASFVAASNIYSYVSLIGQAGISIYLLRYSEELPRQTVKTAYTILLVTSLLALGGFMATLRLIEELITVPGLHEVMVVMIFGLPLQLLSLPATVRLERMLDYKSVAKIELAGQVLYYLVTFLLIWLGYGAVALAMAFVAQQLFAFVFSHIAARERPEFGFDTAVAAKILSYALNFSLSSWIWQIRILVNPLVVGPALGAQAVGIVGMTIGIMDMLTTIRAIVWRVSVSVLRNYSDKHAELRSSVSNGMELQVLANGTVLLGFLWLGDIIVPHVFGQRWLPVLDLFPFIAISYLTIAAFIMHSAVISVLDRNHLLILFHAVHIMVFMLAAHLLVPAYGYVGYGYAELAAVPSYFLMHHLLCRAIGNPDYRLALIWWAGAVAGLFARQIGPVAIAIPFIALTLPASRRKLGTYLKLLQDWRKGGRSQPLEVLP